MIRPLFVASAAIAASCSPAGDQAAATRPERKEIFVGELVAIQGQPVRSALKFRFYSTDGDEVADRYFLESNCFDGGYFDQRHGAFLSGHSPTGTDTEKSPAKLVQEFAENHKTRRCPDDSANFSRLMDLMYAGATLEIDDEDARLTSKTGLSADLIREPMPMFVD